MSDYVPDAEPADEGASPERDQSGVPGAARGNGGAGEASSPEAVTVPDDLSGLDQSAPAPSDGQAEEVAQLKALVAERTADLQRLQAEYVNYKRRVDRDRDLARSAGVEKVLVELLPTLDAVAMADSHGELTGGFKLVADELHKISAKHGLLAFGAVGDEFDPHRHEALMHQQLPGATTTCVSAVMQQGYELGGRILRPARVAVSDPDPDAAPGAAPQNN